MSIEVNWQVLLRRLNPLTQRALLAAVGTSSTRMHYEVMPEHFFAALLDNPDSDVPRILRFFSVDDDRLRRTLSRALEAVRSGHTGKPTFSPRLLEWIQSGWLNSSVDLGLNEIRSGGLMLSLALRLGEILPTDFLDVLAPLSGDRLRKDFDTIVDGTGEGATSAARGGKTGSGDQPGGAHGRAADSALGRFTVDFTAQARAGKIDPIFGRDAEIRQMVDILARRRKNNPIVVGEAGVGKTAVVEGLALRIVKDDVPDVLKGVDLLSLDMGLLQAGAGVRGEFENRLRSVIEEVKGSERPIILFIDEAHTLIGAGGPQGGGDAANLLKPALARGELRTIAATTWSEYKKYFEKDAALSRRFQPIRLDEPSESTAIVMLRGLKAIYEAHHGVAIRDEAVVEAVRLSNRYIEGRQLPDKAVDLLDTCAARVSVSRASTPAGIENLTREIESLEREREAIARDGRDTGKPDEARLTELAAQIATRTASVAELRAKWERETQAAGNVLAQRKAVLANPDDTEARAAYDAARREFEGIRGVDPFVALDVEPDTVAKTVADWTGIPLGSMVRDQAQTVLELEARLGERIKGQPHALATLGQALRSAKAGTGNPSAPMGVFFFVGPSGVGKTETALALADLLFGGDRFVTTINMSEFQEKHAVSQLKGSPPGYIGYEEGGTLTEAVSRRPYSVVLLDEVEKAHVDVMNLFHQVFDKGMLTDGKGREVNFRNTVIVLTSNMGSDIIHAMCSEPEPPAPADLVSAVKPILVGRFKEALNARWTVVPFTALGPEVMREVVVLKLDRIVARLRETHRLQVTYYASVVDAIANRCTEVDTGARNVDHVVQASLLPKISTGILERMMTEAAPAALHLTVGAGGEFELAWQGTSALIGV